MAESYSYFAKYYDSLTQNINYKIRAKHFEKLIKKYGSPGNQLLDAGCGTGSLALEFANFGYNVIGVDLSPQMLSYAQSKAWEAEKEILFVMQNICKLNLYEPVDVVISAQDTINHLKNINDVEAAFKRIYDSLNAGGLFIFDVNTIYKHREVLKNNTFVIESDEVYCVWQNTLNEKNNKITIELDFFEEQNGKYQRYSEEFSENAYETIVLEEKLKATGFEVVGIFEGDTFKTPTPETERIVFAAKKPV